MTGSLRATIDDCEAGRDDQRRTRDEQHAPAGSAEDDVDGETGDRPGRRPAVARGHRSGRRAGARAGRRGRTRPAGRRQHGGRASPGRPTSPRRPTPSAIVISPVSRRSTPRVASTAARLASAATASAAMAGRTVLRADAGDRVGQRAGRPDDHPGQLLPGREQHHRPAPAEQDARSTAMPRRRFRRPGCADVRRLAPVMLLPAKTASS